MRRKYRKALKVASEGVLEHIRKRTLLMDTFLRGMKDSGKYVDKIKWKMSDREWRIFLAEGTEEMHKASSGYVLAMAFINAGGLSEAFSKWAYAIPIPEGKDESNGDGKPHEPA